MSDQQESNHALLAKIDRQFPRRRRFLTIGDNRDARVGQWSKPVTVTVDGNQSRRLRITPQKIVDMRVVEAMLFEAERSARVGPVTNLQVLAF